ncbi:hypothetical protein JCM30760_22320 [Thiomicrorhabdus hydrogeniphila]
MTKFLGDDLEIENAIKEGISSTYQDLLCFTGNDLEIELPEYLLTVNIAKKNS